MFILTFYPNILSIFVDLQCPLRSFLKYTSKLNDNCDAFFQRPKREIKDESTWYDAVPLGHNNLGGLTTIICEKAGVEIRYTNHSLPATTVHVLDVAELAGRHIMSVTGHKSEHSLKPTPDIPLKKPYTKCQMLLVKASDQRRKQKILQRNLLQTRMKISLNYLKMNFLLLTNSQMDRMVQDVAN